MTTLELIIIATILLGYVGIIAWLIKTKRVPNDGQ